MTSVLPPPALTWNVLPNTYGSNVYPWFDSNDLTYLSAALAFLALKDKLKALGATVVSCDHVHWWHNPGTGHWETLYQSATSSDQWYQWPVTWDDYSPPKDRSQTTSKGCWMILQYGTMQILLYNTGSTFAVGMSPSGSFTGGAQGVRPTAPDEVYRTGLPLQTIVGNKWWIHGWGDSTHTQAHLALCYSGEHKMHLYFGTPMPAVASWASPSAFYAFNTTGGHQPWYFERIHWGDQAFGNESYLAVRTSTGWYRAYATARSFGGTYYGPGDNPVIGLISVPDDQTGRYHVEPVGLAVLVPPWYDASLPASGIRKFYGWLKDVWWTPRVGTGNFYPADGSKQLVVLGNVVLPWNGTGVLELATP
jgi:hypothetical protein